MKEKLEAHFARSGEKKSQFARRAKISVRTIERYLAGEQLVRDSLEKIRTGLDRTNDEEQADAADEIDSILGQVADSLQAVRHGATAAR